MAIPDYQTLMAPLLRFAGDNKEHTIGEATDYLASEFKLTESELEELLPSGKQAVFRNRAGWARTYLLKAGLISSIKRGFFKITSRGLEVLETHPTKIDVNYLLKFKEFVEFKTIGKGDASAQPLSEIAQEKSQTPEELLESIHASLRENLATNILQTIKECSPSFFERLVVKLIVAMGYGGSLKEAGQAIGKSGDEGIDGIIKEDKLGLDIIYIQAKRWEGPVGRPEIQKFAGALQGQRAKKGILITTSSFTDGAVTFASNIDTKLILIDGKTFAGLMIDYNVGVIIENTYEVKRIDSDFFTDELF